MSRLVLLRFIQTFLERVERVLNDLWLILCLLGQLVRRLSHHDVRQAVFRLIFLVFLLPKQLSSERVGSLGKLVLLLLLLARFYRCFIISLIGVAALDTLHYLASFGLNFLERAALEATDLTESDLDGLALRPRCHSLLATSILVRAHRLGVGA